MHEIIIKLIWTLLNYEVENRLRSGCFPQFKQYAVNNVLLSPYVEHYQTAPVTHCKCVEMGCSQPLVAGKELWRVVLGFIWNYLNLSGR